MANNEKIVNSRFQQKIDIEANWMKATNFIPKDGEIIFYAAEQTGQEPKEKDGVTSTRAPINYLRWKVGNGIDNVNDLPFASKELIAIDDGNGNIKLQYEGVEIS